MFKSAVRAAPRRILPPRTFTYRSSSRRFLSTAPPSQKSRSWKSSAVRWGLAAGGVYYYNTSTVFAEEPTASIQQLDSSIHHIKDSSQPTIDAIVEEKRLRAAQRLEQEKQREQVNENVVALAEGDEEEGEDGMGSLEEEADQQGAFNPETGEINWDCPCLGGMAHGPCGEEFKAAFSCFVYSSEEPKGVECIDKFKGMQDCFRQHPEMYGAELEDDEDGIEEELRARESQGEGAEDSPSSLIADPTTETTEAPKPAEIKLTETKPTEKKPIEKKPAGSITETQAEEQEGESLSKTIHDTSSN